MKDSIYLFSKSDRLGSHLLQYISIVIYAYYNNLYIVYEEDKLNYTNSVFVKALLKYIDKHNEKFPSKNYFEQYKNLNIQEYWLNFQFNYDRNNLFYSCDTLIISTQVVYSIKSDLISYFKKYIYQTINHNVERFLPTNYNVPFNPKKTILLHLRLDDVKDRNDYDGEICSNYYKNRIDNNYESIQGITTNVGNTNFQTPLAKHKIETCLSEAKEKYPEHEVIIVTSPGNYVIDYPYKCIRSDDESYDLFLLCNCDILILSKSTFSLSAAFLGSAKEIWCPLWGHFVCTGLYTKYDKSKLNYFF